VKSGKKMTRGHLNKRDLGYIESVPLWSIWVGRGKKTGRGRDLKGTVISVDIELRGLQSKDWHSTIFTLCSSRAGKKKAYQGGMSTASTKKAEETKPQLKDKEGRSPP